MQMQVCDRIALLGILPQEGDFTTLKIVRELREALSFTEAEHAELSIQHEGQTIRWNVEADTPREIDIGKKAAQVIAGSLETLNSEKALRGEHVRLYELFVEDTA